MNRLYNFIFANGTQYSGSFQCKPINYPLSSGSFLVSGDPLEFSASNTYDFVDNVYKLGVSLEADSDWYINLSGSNTSASAHIVSGSYITGSLCNVLFKFIDLVRNPDDVTSVQIKPKYNNIGFKESFVLEDVITYVTNDSGFLTCSLVPQIYTVTLKGSKKDTVFGIFPSGSQSTASAIVVKTGAVSNNIVSANQASYAYTAQASDLRYYRKDASLTFDSASYANYASTAGTAITASYALNGGGSGGTSLNTGSTYPITASWAVNWDSQSLLNYIDSLVGSSDYILTATGSGVGSSYLMRPTGSIGALYTITTGSIPNGGYVASWITPSGMPHVNVLRDGIYECSFLASVTNAAGTSRLTPEIYLANSSGVTFYELETGASSDPLTVALTRYNLAILNPTPLTMSLTDRLVLKLKLTTDTAGKTVNVQVEGNTLSHLSTPLSTISTNIDSASYATFAVSANTASYIAPTFRWTALTASKALIGPSADNSASFYISGSPNLSIIEVDRYDAVEVFEITNLGKTKVTNLSATGSLLGTASYANTCSVYVYSNIQQLNTTNSIFASSSISASYATTASYALNGGSGGTSLNTGSTYPITSSWATNALFANAATSATTAGTATNATSASYSTNAGYAYDAAHADAADSAADAISASYAKTASFALNGGGSGTSLNTGSTYPITASWAVNVVNGSSFNGTGSLYGTASWAKSSSISLIAEGADFALDTTYAITSSYAVTASYALNGGSGPASTPTFAMLSIVNNWITMSFADTDEYVNLTTAGIYNFTCSNLVSSQSVGNVTLFINNTTTSTSSLSFPSNWTWNGIEPAYLTASKSAMLNLTQYGGTSTIVAAFSVSY